MCTDLSVRLAEKDVPSSSVAEVEVEVEVDNRSSNSLLETDTHVNFSSSLVRKTSAGCNKVSNSHKRCASTHSLRSTNTTATNQSEAQQDSRHQSRARAFSAPFKQHQASWSLQYVPHHPPVGRSTNVISSAPPDAGSAPGREEAARCRLRAQGFRHRRTAGEDLARC